VKVTKGADYVVSFNRTENSFRTWCKQCGGHLLNRHPQWGLVDVYAATIPEVAFKPGLHVNYQESVLPMNDGVPKLKDIPKALGGTEEPWTGPVLS
jgi:hypothetical protein